MEREILIAHSREQGDFSPLQFISTKLLEHYRRCEAELAAVKSAGALPPDIPGCACRAPPTMQKGHK